MNKHWNPNSPYGDMRDKDFGRRRKSQRLTPEEFRKVYLFLYNLYQFVGFVYILVVLLLRYAKEGSGSMAGSYKALSRVMKFLHLMQILDIVHPLFGYITGNPFFPGLQLLNRLILLFVMIDGEPRMQTKPVVFYLFLLYTLSDVVRYPYYMLKVFHINVGLLTWLRYTLWVPTFPMTFVCEGVILLRDIPYFQETGAFSVALPNPANISFYLPHAIRLYLLLGFFPLMYMGMMRNYKQRRAILQFNSWDSTTKLD